MDDYITVVEVDDPTSKDTNRHPVVKRNNSIQDSSFITVLSINDIPSKPQTTSVIHTNASPVTDTNHNRTESPETETVHVYRLPGERLGFGLKFQGGTRSSEKVQRLYIQSCAKDSPASRVAASWGFLREGDEIVSIDGKAVCELTRIDCVRCLKDNVAIELVVRNGYGQLPASDGSSEEDSRTTKQSPPPPPPVPPRKLVKRRQIKDGKVANVDDKPFTPPPDAEYYINLFSDENSLKAAGSESDDTASTISTISTVIDKFSIGSNYSSETDLSGYAGLNGTAVMNKTELAKVLKPFTMLEKEFKVVEDASKKSASPANNYENVELKVEKRNVYENVELKPKLEVNAATAPKPKPRHSALAEPKKRSIIPTPRKINGVKAEPQPPESPKSEDTKLITKIPKAIAAVFGSSSSPKAMERSKTESELKLSNHSKSTSDLRKQCELFLESEVRSSQENLTADKHAEENKAAKSRIPVVLTPKKSPEAAVEPPPKIETIVIKPRTMVQKQKSETDLKLTSYRPKDQRPTNLPIVKPASPSKASLQRSNSAESTQSPKTMIPVLNSPTEPVTPTKPKGPKPKPPERVQSLGKTQIPKLLTSPSSTTTQVIVSHADPTPVPASPPTPTMQTFKQTPLQPTPSPPQNREIRFKIQTYESSKLEKEKEKDRFTDVNGNEETKMPSLFDLVRKNSPPSVRKDDPPTDRKDEHPSESKNAEESPVIVRKCIKISDVEQEADTYYSSSSSGSDDEDEEDVGCGDEKEYEIEDGEKLGPPEVVNGPGPSEAYFNMYWHSNMLPTIGEVEEEFSSLELQAVSNGPIVIVNDVSQQQRQHPEQQSKPSTESPSKQQTPAETISTAKTVSSEKAEKTAAALPPPNSGQITSGGAGDRANKTPPAVTVAVASDDSENARDKITPPSDIDSRATTTEKCHTSDDNNNASVKENASGIETTTPQPGLITEKLHQRQVSATNGPDSEFSTRDNSVRGGNADAPESTPSEMSSSGDAESDATHGGGTVVGRTITKTTKTTTTRKTVKSSQRIESFEQIDRSSPNTPEISVVKKSEAQEESSSSSQLVEEEKIQSPPGDATSVDLCADALCGATKVSTLEETYQSDQKASAEIIVRQDDKEHVHQSVECQSERAALKALLKEDCSRGKPKEENPAKEGITVTVSTETRLIEIDGGDGSVSGDAEDRQSIVTGILSLSESGLRTRQTANAIEVVECAHEKREGFAEVDVVRDLKKRDGTKGLKCVNRKSLEGGKIDLEEVAVAVEKGDVPLMHSEQLQSVTEPEIEAQAVVEVPKEKIQVQAEVKEENPDPVKVEVQETDKLVIVSEGPVEKTVEDLLSEEEAPPELDLEEIITIVEVQSPQVESSISILETQSEKEAIEAEPQKLDVLDIKCEIVVPPKPSFEIQSPNADVLDIKSQEVVISEPVVGIQSPNSEIFDVLSQKLANFEPVVETKSSRPEVLEVQSKIEATPTSIVDFQTVNVVSSTPILVGEIKKVDDSVRKVDPAKDELRGFEKMFNDLAPVYVLHKNIIHCDPPNAESDAVDAKVDAPVTPPAKVEVSVVNEPSPPPKVDVKKPERPKSITLTKDKSVESKKSDPPAKPTPKKAETPSPSKDQTSPLKPSNPEPKRECTAKVIDVMKKAPLDAKDSRSTSLKPTAHHHPTEARTEPNGLECNPMPAAAAAASASTSTSTATASVNVASAKPKPMERIILGVEHNADGHATPSSTSGELQSKVKTASESPPSGAAVTAASAATPEASKSSASTGSSSVEPQRIAVASPSLATTPTSSAGPVAVSDDGTCHKDSPGKSNTHNFVTSEYPSVSFHTRLRI